MAVANDGELLATASGQGVLPLLEVLRQLGEKSQGATFADKVVGRAAAMLMIDAGARRVYARVMSRTALVTLTNAGIPSDSEETPDRISNRDGTGLCPMEELSLEYESPALFREEIEKRLL